jgi:hypothetical protein
MPGAISPLLNTPSCRGAQLKHRNNFTLLLPVGLHTKAADPCLREDRQHRSVTSDARAAEREAS